MENQYSLDLESPTSERTSTSLDGQSGTEEIPNLDKFHPLFQEDSIGSAFAHEYFDQNEGKVKFVIHSSLDNPTLEGLKIARDISCHIDDSFKEKGVTELYTWGYTPDHDKYNKFLGYFPTGKVIQFAEGCDPGYVIQEYKKVL